MDTAGIAHAIDRWLHTEGFIDQPAGPRTLAAVADTISQLLAVPLPLPSRHRFEQRPSATIGYMSARADRIRAEQFGDDIHRRVPLLIARDAILAAASPTRQVQPDVLSWWAGDDWPDYHQSLDAALHANLPHVPRGHRTPRYRNWDDRNRHDRGGRRHIDTLLDSPATAAIHSPGHLSLHGPGAPATLPWNHIGLIPTSPNQPKSVDQQLANLQHALAGEGAAALRGEIDNHRAAATSLEPAALLRHAIAHHATYVLHLSDTTAITVGTTTPACTARPRHIT